MRHFVWIVMVVLIVGCSPRKEQKQTSKQTTPPITQQAVKPVEMASSAPQVPNVPTTNINSIMLTGIISGEKPAAIIDGKIYKPGDTVNNLKINDIGPDYVEFIDERGKPVQKKIR